MADYDRDYGPIAPRVKYGPKFDAGDVRKLREETGAGMMECKRSLMRKQMLKDLEVGRCGLNTALLYDMLEYMLEEHLIG